MSLPATFSLQIAGFSLGGRSLHRAAAEGHFAA